MSEGAGRVEPADPVSATHGVRRWGDLLPRVLSGLVMVALALGSAVVGGHVFAVFWLVAALAVLWEWQHLIGGPRVTLRFASGAVALAVAAAVAKAGHPIPAVAAVGVGAGLVGIFSPGFRLTAAAGVFYAGALAVSVILLRGSFPGLVAILWLFAVVWGTDIMAYVGGRLIGGPKLAPRWSPSKTWSGFLVGITAGALAGAAVAPLEANHGAVALVGLAAAVLSQGGDILESSLKRHYGVKDASHLIPGHGGVMDRLDGFIVAAVFAAILGSARAGLDAAGLGLFNWS